MSDTNHGSRLCMLVYCRYNNWAGMEQLISMGYVDPEKTNLNAQPLMEEAQARRDRMRNLKPWHLQDQRVSGDGVSL